MKHSFDTPQRGNSIHHSFGNPNASNTTRSTINIVESPDNRGSIIATTEPSSPPPPQQPLKDSGSSPRRKFNPFGHSRSHSHTSNNGKRLFYPVHHDGRYHNMNDQYPPISTVSQSMHPSSPVPSSPTPTPAPAPTTTSSSKPKREQSLRYYIPRDTPPQTPPMSQLPKPVGKLPQPNWTNLIPPLPGKPQPSYNSPDSFQQQKQNKLIDTDDFNFGTEPIISSPELSSRQHPDPLSNQSNFNSNTINNYSNYRSSTRSGLDPSQRHSIAVSPTPEKQDSATQSTDTINTSSIRPVPSVYVAGSSSSLPHKQQQQQEPSSLSKLERKPGRKKSRKVCAKCGLEITSQFVRALNNAYHVDCFTCHECGKQCSAKFFPYEITNEQDGTKTQVALCEYDYFKKLDLICYVCNSALRGPYITALGNKYHLEHFRCNVCQRVFESDESYYEHDNNIYCHFHYSKLYASHCEGCQSSIVKQFVELFRGGRNQHWHPECYMVHKFWNVCITPDSVGLQKLFDLPDDVLNGLKLVKDDNESHISVDSAMLMSIEQQIEQVVLKCWVTLSGYEEITAKCISDMLLCACTGNKFNGIVVTGKLVLNVEVLFNALDYVILMCKSSHELLHKKFGTPPNKDDLESSSTEEEYFQMLKKEPRNITGKIMSYLAILRKSDHIAKSGSLSAELLSVITGCAHYLKLLIRLGLYNALKLNRLYGTTNAIEKFLQLTSEHEAISLLAGDSKTQLSLINSKLTIPASSTDACSSCAKSIEKSCLKLDNNRWHVRCFVCSLCKRTIPSIEASETKFDVIHQSIVCRECPCEHFDTGFHLVSDLSQLIYLLKIALFRSRSVMKVDLTKVPRSYLSDSQSDTDTVDVAQDNYSQTLNDVTSLRSKRQSQKLSKSIKKKARKSIIVEAPEADKARKEDIKTHPLGMKSSGVGTNDTSRSSGINDETTIADELNDLSFDSQTSKQQGSRKTSSASQLSYNPGGDENLSVTRKSLKIRDEPQRQTTNTHLDRTSDLLKNEKSLTLDDIPRIVAAEQAREQRPNAFKHHNSLYQRQTAPHRLKATGHTSTVVTPTGVLDNILNTSQPHPEEPVAVRKQKYYSELTKDEHFIIRHIAVEALSHISKSYSNKEELLSLIQTKKQPTFWDKFKFGGGDGKKDKVMAVFGVDLQVLTKKYGIDSDLGVGPSKLRIPIVVDDIIAALRQKDMSVEGIFRLNGNIKKLRELTEQINKNPLKSPDFSIQNAVQLAALMKKWLRELPNPLLTFGLYDMWVSSQRQVNPVLRKRVLQLTYCMLPRSHRNLVEVLLYFFSWVASFSEIDEETGSKMDIHNLATVIAPNILISKQSSNSSSGNSSNSGTNNSDSQQASGDNYFLAIEVVNQLIEQHEEFSIIPLDILEFYEKCGFDKFDSTKKEITTRDVMIKIDKELKEKPDYFDNFELKNPTGSLTSQEVKRNSVSRIESKIQNRELNGISER